MSRIELTKSEVEESKNVERSNSQIASFLFFGFLAWIFLGILKVFFSSYSYPQQDNVIYLTFREASKYQHHFARDLFASLHQTHFDYFWPILRILPDVLFWGSGALLLSIVTNALFFSSTYLITYAITRARWLSFITVILCFSQKHILGFGLFTTEFIHRNLIYSLVNFSLAFFLKGKNPQAYFLLIISTFFYPPLLYFVWPSVIIALIFEFGLKRAFSIGVISAILLLPLFFAYYEAGNFSHVLISNKVDLSYYFIFIVGLESIFSLEPLDFAKIANLASYFGIVVLSVLSIKTSLSSSSEFRRMNYILAALLGCSLISIVLTYLGLEFAIKLQLVRMARFLAYCGLISISSIIISNWNPRKVWKNILFLLSGFSISFLTILFGFLCVRSKSSLKLLICAVLIVFGVSTTHSFGFPNLNTKEKTDWYDVSLYARENIAVNSLVLIPPVAKGDHCGLDNSVTFRLLSRRSTTLKVSDGIELGYNSNFALVYKKYIDDLLLLLKIEFQSENSCEFREKIHTAWFQLPMSDLLRYGKEQGASHALVSNRRLAGRDFDEFTVYKGKIYSLLSLQKTSNR